jgi:hypothetical protein
VLVPAALIVLAHYLTVYKFGFHRIYVQLICIALTVPIGYDMRSRVRWGVGLATVVGAAIAILAILGSSAVVWLIDDVAIMPASAAEWRLTIEYAIGLMLGTMTGNAFATALDRTETGRPSGFFGVVARAIAGFLAPLRGGKTVADQLKSIEQSIHAVMAVLTAAAALYAGIKSALP